jgi:hypothetical protein
MSWLDWYILVGLGGFFILLGILSIIWGRSEEKSYYEAIAQRRDVREFLEHLPFRPEPHALKVGGRIAIAVGIVCLIFGAIYWFLW